MSAQAMGWVYQHSPYKGSDLLIHLALADSANDMHGYELWASQTWIAEKARVSRQTVNTFMARAISDGFIALLADHSKERKPNRYRFLMPKSASQVWSAKRDWNAPEDHVGHVAVDDMGHSAHVAVDDMHMSPETTCHVVRDDTNPREPNLEPNPLAATPPSTPSEPNGSRGSGLDQDSQVDGEVQTGSSSHERARATDSGDHAREGSAPRERVKFDTSGFAYDLCLLLQGKVREYHGYSPKIKNANASGWVAVMNRLVTQGPNGHEEREPVDPAKIAMLIEYVYSYGTEGNFRWADQIRSPHDLVKHWDKLRSWANREHQERAKEARSGSTNQAWMVRSLSDE